jgi:hypothetical protein
MGIYWFAGQDYCIHTNAPYLMVSACLEGKDFDITYVATIEADYYINSKQTVLITTDEW